MAKILRMSDRLKLTVGEVVFKLAPIDHLKKQDLLSCTRIVKGEEHFDLLKAQALYIKYSLKDISGIEDYNGDEYKLEFDGDDLSDDCVSEILNLEERESLTISAWQLLNGVKELTDPNTGKKLKGVKLEVVSEGK